MNSEVNGIDVEEALIQRYVGLNREEAENLALEVSVEIGKEIADSADGFYVITPFNRGQPGQPNRGSDSGRTCHFLDNYRVFP